LSHATDDEGPACRPARRALLAAAPTSRARRDGSSIGTSPRPTDWPGLAILALTLVAALLAIRGTLDGGLGTIAAIAAVPLALAFVAIELRTDHPAVDPRLLAPPFAAALAGVFGMTVILHGCFLVVPLLVERLQSGTPATTGIVLRVSQHAARRSSDRRLGGRQPAEPF
jgi:hypothetical protein